MIRKLFAAALIALAALSAPSFAQVNKTTLNTSATIATGNTFQQLLAAGPRFTLTIQNNNTNGDNCWLAFGTRANGTAITAGSAQKTEAILLAPGGSFQRYYPYVPSDAFVGTCQNTNDTLYIDVQ